jgi:hypothetical protein
MKRLVGVDVADPSKQGLVQQGRLDGDPTGARPAPEVERLRLQGVDTEPVQAGAGLGAAQVLDLAEATWVAKQYRWPAVRELELQVGVPVRLEPERVGRSEQAGSIRHAVQARTAGVSTEQLSGHAQVQQQATPVVEMSEDVLPVARQRFDPAPD